jgi:hypothetical protein
MDCEQSDTESLAMLCNCVLTERGNLNMAYFPHPLLAGIRSLGAFLAASLRKFLKMERHDGDFALQRMCPFCGLITPRHETCCLECGKVLSPA